MLLLKILSNYFEYFKIFIRNVLTDRSYMLLMFLLVLLFITLLLVIYSNSIKDIISKKHVLNSEYINNVSKQEEILVLYFYTEWCPYCKQSMPELNKFEEYIKGETGSANYNITLTKIDCDKQTTIADKYKIEAYPSIKLIYKNKVYDYDAKPNKANLIQFLETFTHYKST
jgi:thioredoxin-like negative regulator of GroEL